MRVQVTDNPYYPEQGKYSIRTNYGGWAASTLLSLAGGWMIDGGTCAVIAADGVLFLQRWFRSRIPDPPCSRKVSTYSHCALDDGHGGPCSGRISPSERPRVEVPR